MCAAERNVCLVARNCGRKKTKLSLFDPVRYEEKAVIRQGTVLDLDLLSNIQQKYFFFKSLAAFWTHPTIMSRVIHIQRIMLSKKKAMWTKQQGLTSEMLTRPSWKEQSLAF